MRRASLHFYINDEGSERGQGSGARNDNNTCRNTELDRMKAAGVHPCLHLHFRPCISHASFYNNGRNGYVALVVVKWSKLKKSAFKTGDADDVDGMFVCRRMRCIIIVGVFCQRFMIIFHTAALAPFLDDGASS